MGGKTLGRYFAQNFSDSELARAIHYCQKRCQVYITVNTLVTDREFKQLSNFLALIYEEGRTV